MNSTSIRVCAMLVAGLTFRPATAQEPCRILCSPVVVAQPAIAIGTLFNGRRIDAEGNREQPWTDPVLRFAAIIPTEVPWLSFEGVFQWSPSHVHEVPHPVTGNLQEEIHNAPTLLYGPMFTLVRGENVTLSFNALAAYSHNDVRVQEHDGGVIKEFEHQLVLELQSNVRLGRILWRDGSPWLRGLGVYGILAQQVTNRPKHFGSDEAPYSPAAAFGLWIPIAPPR